MLWTQQITRNAFQISFQPDYMEIDKGFLTGHSDHVFKS